MFITKKHIRRRTFLRGLGATVALPLLDSMIPAGTALAQTAANPVLRSAFIYVPMGAIMGEWTPQGDALEFREVLKPLEPYRDRVNIVTGTMLHAPNGHPTSTAMWLNGVVPPHGTEIHCGISADQLIANRVGEETTYPSLEVATEDHSTALGTCGGDFPCAVMNTIAWRSPTVPLPMELNPRVVFERLFGGDAATPEERLAGLRDRSSILDGIASSLKDFGANLPVSDKAKLSDYLDNVREIERRIQKAEKQNSESSNTALEAPLGIPESFEEHLKLMYDLILVAFQGDVTRVATYMVARELSGKTHPGIGLPEGWHGISHHQNNPAQMARCVKLQNYHATLFAEFIGKLKASKDGDGTLLDHSMIMYGSGMSNSNVHTHENLPIMLVGGANGKLKGNRHVRVAEGTPLSNLLLAVLEKAGVKTERLGDSNGTISL
jgi:Protein of unknown function (DUF1552)